MIAQTFRFLVSHPLTRRRPASAIARAVRWQLASRLAPGPIAVPIADGARLLVRRGMAGATGSVYAGLPDFEDMAFMLHVLRPRDLFGDVGANVGAYSVLAGKVAGARVIACEPIASTAAVLRDNIAINGIGDRSEIHECAAGFEGGTVRMTSDADATNRVLANAETYAGSAVDVPVRSLDSLLAGRVPALIKIDVEGHEAAVFAGAAATLAHGDLRALIVETFEHTALHELLRVHGFEAATYDPWTRELTAKTPAPTQNTIFVRDWAWVRARVKGAEKVTVMGASF